MVQVTARKTVKLSNGSKRTVKADGFGLDETDAVRRAFVALNGLIAAEEERIAEALRELTALADTAYADAI